MKILIQDDNLFFIKGVQSLLNSFFYSSFSSSSNDKSPEYYRDLTKENVQAADILILRFPPGGISLCTPLLHYRKSFSILFIVTDVINGLRKFQLPNCIHHAFIIDKKITATRFTSLLRESLHDPYIYQSVTCKGCRKKSLTRTQHSVGEALFREVKISEIAEMFSISSKTAYSHKNAIKLKFALQTNHELYLFLNYLYKDRPSEEIMFSRHVRCYNMNSFVSDD